MTARSALCFLVIAPIFAQTAKTGSLTGTVKNSVTGEPVKDALIEIQRIPGVNRTESATPDGNGIVSGKSSLLDHDQVARLSERPLQIAETRDTPADRVLFLLLHRHGLFRSPPRKPKRIASDKLFPRCGTSSCPASQSTRNHAATLS